MDEAKAQQPRVSFRREGGKQAFMKKLQSKAITMHVGPHTQCIEVKKHTSNANKANGHAIFAFSFRTSGQTSQNLVKGSMCRDERFLTHPEDKHFGRGCLFHRL